VENILFMRVTFLCHSSFVIEAGDSIILFDPWLKGPAYHKQWYVYPPPVDTSLAEKANIIIYSHGHEDHMHPGSMDLLDKNAHVFFPFQWRAGISSYFRHKGFTRITEAASFKTYETGDIKITFIGYSLESVVVIEYEGEVLVNINDALNSNHENAAAFILQKIKEKWPKIDYLYSGWSGASYFPNKVRYKNKNDVEVGKIREQFFAHNFCKFSAYLQPKTSIPFPPGFVLLTEENQWINDVKFERERLHEYFPENFPEVSKINFLFPWPDDVIESHALQKRSALHEQTYEEISNGWKELYRKEIKETNMVQPVNENYLETLNRNLVYWLNKNKVLYHEAVLRDVFFSIELTDTLIPAFIHVWYKDKRFHTKISEKDLEERKLKIRTKAVLLAYSLSKVWGGDVLTIGYGIDVEMYDENSLEKNLDIVCVRLITRFPMARKDIFRYPLRAFRYYLKSPSIASLWLKQKVTLKPYVNRFPYNERDHWISFKKCDLCKVCQIPEIF
jgi:hypothetical protein